MISPDLAETVKRLRELTKSQWCISLPASEMSSILDALDEARANQQHVFSGQCIDALAEARTRIASLESSLAEARKGARTKGTVEVCAHCGLQMWDAKRRMAKHQCGPNCPMIPAQHPTAPQETTEKEGE